MRRLPHLGRTVAAQLLLVGAAALAVSLVGASLVRDAAVGEAHRRLQARAEALAARLEREGTPPSASSLQELARGEGLTLWLRRADGSTLGSPPPSSGADVSHVTVGATLAGGAELGATSPLSDLPDRVRRWHLAVALGALALAAGLLAVSAFVFRRLERSLAGLAALASDRDDDGQLAPLGAEDLLAATRATVGGLHRQLAGLTARHDQLRAVLASMAEAVIVVDDESRVLFLNDAAAALLGTTPHGADGRPVGEILRSTELQRLLEEAAAGAPAEGELAVRGASERFLQAHCARVVGADGRPHGSVLVLNDVTRLRRLERVRRDFVANVSHEIKTPITAVAGSVETLLDGALDNREEAERFLRIIERHAGRLAAVVEDLLTLARIEQEDEGGAVRLDEVAVPTVLQAALEACRFKADQESVALVVDVEPGLRALMNAPLIEQALVNLIDNAVKYSPEGSAVTVSAASDGNEVVLRVTDRGTGIAAADLPRLFERFYRVDRARSRKLGGTGLGLAIVKHVAQVHGGSTTVESRVGRGSSFALHLPQRRPDGERDAGDGAGGAAGTNA